MSWYWGFIIGRDFITALDLARSGHRSVNWCPKFWHVTGISLSGNLQNGIAGSHGSDGGKCLGTEPS